MPTSPAEDHVALGEGPTLVPLYVTPAVADALETVQQILRTDTRLYRRVELMLGRIQPMMYRGPLTDLLAALVGKEA